MIKSLSAAAAVIVLAAVSTPAYAGHCPKDVAAIDEALVKGSSVSRLGQIQIRQLRDKGRNLQNAGKHDEALEALHRAMEVMGIKH